MPYPARTKAPDSVGARLKMTTFTGLELTLYNNRAGTAAVKLKVAWYSGFQENRYVYLFIDINKHKVHYY